MSEIFSGDVFSNQEEDLQDDLDHYEFEDMDDDIDIPGPGEDEAQGVFADRESVFDDELEDHSHHVVTRAQELQPALLPGKEAPVSHKIVSVWSKDGHMMVAHAINGQRVEEWRQPSKAEWQLFKERGQIVRPAGSAVGSAEAGTWKKWALGAALLAAAGAAGWYYYQKQQESDEDLDENAKEI